MIGGLLVKLKHRGRFGELITKGEEVRRRYVMGSVAIEGRADRCPE